MEERLITIQENIKTLYESLFKYSNDLLLRIDLKGKVLSANDKAIGVFGHSLLGSSVTEIFDGVESYIDSLEGTEIVQYVYVRHKKVKRSNYRFKLTLVPIVEKERTEEIMLIAKDLKQLESFKGEVERLREHVQKMEQEKKKWKLENAYHDHVKTIANTMGKLEKANQKLREINKKFTKELELAAVLQKSLVPERVPEDKHLRFCFHFEPTGLVGGDYYDVIDLGKGKKGIILADVSGHGVSSAFIAAMLKISFNNYAPRCSSPSEVLDKLNREYCRVIQTGDYVTAFYAIFDPLNKRMVYSGAGHPKPLFLHGESKTIELFSSDGFFIGMFEESDYVDTVNDFFPTDRYLVYTDGIIEAFSEERNEQFGEKRLFESFRRYQNYPLDSMIRSIINAVKRFMHKSKFYDDLAMVAIEYKD